MKKILITMIVICAAIVANAASFKWSAANIYDANGDLYSGLATLYCTSSGFESWSNVASVVDGKIIPSTTIGAENAYFSDESFRTSNPYSFYFVIVDDATKKTFTSAVASKSGQANATPTITFGSQLDATKTNGATNWKSDAVPEPTSGLLLLCGLAGLALRRKRA